MKKSNEKTLTIPVTLIDFLNIFSKTSIQELFYAHYYQKCLSQYG